MFEPAREAFLQEIEKIIVEFGFMLTRDTLLLIDRQALKLTFGAYGAEAPVEKYVERYLLELSGRLEIADFKKMMYKIQIENQFKQLPEWFGYGFLLDFWKNEEGTYNLGVSVKIGLYNIADNLEGTEYDLAYFILENEEEYRILKMFDPEAAEQMIALKIKEKYNDFKKEIDRSEAFQKLTERIKSVVSNNFNDARKVNL